MKNTVLRAITGFCIATLILGIFYFMPPWVFTATLLALFMGISYEWRALNPHASIVSWILYPALPCIILLLCNGIDYLRPLVGLLFILVFIHDTSAYIIGSVCGRHKLAPSISPGKTWEGFIGGLCGVTIALCMIAQLYEYSYVWIAPYALSITLLATVGDLYVSWHKRRQGVKDTGTLLPGHGGLLDRCDSLLFCAYGLAIAAITHFWLH